MSEVRAKLRYSGSSAQKMRRVMTAVRGAKAEEALTFLQAMPQTGAARLAKLLKSAIANAVENQGLHKEDLGRGANFRQRRAPPASGAGMARAGVSSRSFAGRRM